MDSYIEKCEKAKEIQKLWKPKVGDRVWRKHNFFGEKIDKQIWSKDKREEIIILTYASDVDGYFHATKDGESRIFKSHNEAHKATCIWLPTQEQLQGMVIDKYIINATLQLGFTLFLCKDMNPKEPLKSSIGKITLLINYSMNELWLAFVMKEKFRKSWSREKKEWEAIK